MTDWWSAARQNRLFWMAVTLAVSIVVIDQAVKLWILHGLRLPELVAVFPDGATRTGHVDISAIFDLSYVENRGVSFGLFAGGIMSRVLLSTIAVAVTVFVLHWAGRLDRRVAALGAGVIVGGAIGNAIDRISYGYVVDFFDFSGLGFPWVFNVADVAINVGVAFLAYDAFIDAPRRQKAAVAGVSPPATSQQMTGEAADRNLTETKSDEVFPFGHGSPIRRQDD